jgi:type II secretory ATPase GspE/PulE/Tfp pilus assembly ATPase PilB-like protein
MRPMFLDGLDKVRAGVTTVEEVLRVTREAA